MHVLCPNLGLSFSIILKPCHYLSASATSLRAPLACFVSDLWKQVTDMGEWLSKHGLIESSEPAKPGDHLQRETSWGDLKPDIEYMILDKLPEVVEHIRFGAVCKEWCQISENHQLLNKSFHKVLPMLLVASQDAPAKEDPPKLYALSCLGNYYSDLQLKIPFSGTRYCGSSYGWIVTQNEDFTVTLIYPFGREVRTIHLPALKHWIEGYDMTCNKLVISPDSTPDDYTILTIYGDMEELATIKSGENSWVYIPPKHEAEPASLYSDIVFYQGEVYVVSMFCMVVKVDIHARPTKVTVLHPLNRRIQFRRTYLVESTSSDLYLLQRCYNNDSTPDKDLATIGFNIHKLKIKEERVELIDQKDSKDLSGDTFFVGDNKSIAVKANGCQPNSIYFMDDLHDPGYHKPSGPIDIGYYNVEDGTVGRFYEPNPAHKEGVARPIWITPRQHVHFLGGTRELHTWIRSDN